MKAEEGPRRGRAIVLALALVVVWLVALAPRQLAKTDEGRYAEIAREMVQTGDWLTPRLDGIKYFEKPALQYWGTAIADQAFGINRFSARFWTGLTGLLGLALVGWAAHRVYGRATAISSVAVLASSMLYLLLGHIDTLDMGLTCFMTLSLASILVTWFAQPPIGAKTIFLAWLGAALAVLSKGLIGLVLPSAVILLYLLRLNDRSTWRRLRAWPGLVLFLAVSAPWFIAVSIANPGFAQFFFIHEHIERFLTHTHHRVGPWWYFIPVLALGLMPWLTLLPPAVSGVFRPPAPPEREAQDREVQDREAQRQHRADGLLLLWAGFIFVFFSVSGSKLPSYILPIMPALAILIGRALQHLPLRALVWHARCIALFGVVALGTGLAASRFADYADEQLAYRHFGQWLAAGCALLVMAAWSSQRAFQRAARERGILVLAAGGVLCGVLGLMGYQALDRFASAAYVADRMAPLLTANMPIFSIDLYEQTLPFYLQHTVILVDHRDELDFGLTQQPELWIPTLSAFAQRWAAEPQALAIMPPSSLDKLRALNLSFRPILQDRRFVVIAKP